MSLPQGINIDEPRYPQTTYFNRAKHFLIVTNPIVSLVHLKLDLKHNFCYKNFLQFRRMFLRRTSLWIGQLESSEITRPASQFLMWKARMSCGMRSIFTILRFILTLEVSPIMKLSPQSYHWLAVVFVSEKMMLIGRMSAQVPMNMSKLF